MSPYSMQTFTQYLQSLKVQHYLYQTLEMAALGPYGNYDKKLLYGNIIRMATIVYPALYNLH